MAVEKDKRLADRLSAVQQKYFVGRTDELALFEVALSAIEPAFSVLHIYGPGGIGKTTLLHQYIRLATNANFFTVYLDGHHIDPSPQSFLNTLRVILSHEDPLAYLAEFQHVAFFIDTYEFLQPLDNWLRNEFLPHLPEMSLTVICGRNAPSNLWYTAPGWRDLTYILPLRNLPPDESRNYLRKRNVPDNHHKEVLKFTHGHPLALSLVADVVVRQQIEFKPESAPDIVRALLEHFIQHVPTSQHRQALEICVHARVTSESLLEYIFRSEDAHHLFLWLYELTFIEHNSEGIFPHDIVREVLDIDLRWRHPERYAEIHRQVRRYLVNCVQTQTGIEQQRAMYSLMYMHQHDTLWQPYHVKETFGHVFAETASKQDHPFILEMVKRHEGQDSAQIADYWLNRQPHQFIVFRNISSELVGFMMVLLLHQATEQDVASDPAAKAALDFIERYPHVRHGEEIVHFRFAMGLHEYQTANLFSAVSQCTGSYAYTHSNLAWTFFCMADPDFWQPVLNYLNHQRSPEAEFKVGGRHYGVFSHDWRAEPLDVFDAIMTEREIATHLKLENLQQNIPVPLLVLSKAEFDQAVRQALRDYTTPDILVANPLMRSRLLHHNFGEQTSPEQLQEIIRQAVDALKTNPKHDKYHRAIFYTYLQPIGTQEVIAERLHLPFGTYRTHLNIALERITNWLWQHELHDFETNSK